MLGFFTADRIGTNTGGGIVTKNELEALASLGENHTMEPRTKKRSF